MAQPGSSLTVSSVKEELNSGKPVHFLSFRFSTAHQKWDLEKVHRQIMETGWQKLPDLESSYVWFGSNPPEVVDILQKASYDNHVCRYMTGSLSDIGLLEGTGVAPVVSEGKSGKQVAAPTSTLLNYGFLPKLEPVNPAITEEED